MVEVHTSCLAGCESYPHPTRGVPGIVQRFGGKKARSSHSQCFYISARSPGGCLVVVSVEKTRPVRILE